MLNAKRLPVISIGALIVVVIFWNFVDCKFDMFACAKLKCVKFISCSEDSHAPGYHAVPRHALHDVEGGFKERAGYVYTPKSMFCN